jgi:hypothetical protein
MLKLRIAFSKEFEYGVAQLKSGDEYSRADEAAIVIEPKITS